DLLGHVRLDGVEHFRCRRERAGLVDGQERVEVANLHRLVPSGHFDLRRRLLRSQINSFVDRSSVKEFQATDESRFARAPPSLAPALSLSPRRGAAGLIQNGDSNDDGGDRTGNATGRYGMDD